MPTPSILPWALSLLNFWEARLAGWKQCPNPKTGSHDPFLIMDPQGAIPSCVFSRYPKYIWRISRTQESAAPQDSVSEMKKSPQQTQGNQVADTRKYSTLRPYLLACFEAGEPIFSFGVFFSSSWKLITKLNFTFYLDSLPCSLHLEWKDQMKRRLTKNGRFIFHVFLILVCLLIHLLPIGIFLLKIQIMDTGERASWWASWR